MQLPTILINHEKEQARATTITGDNGNTFANELNAFAVQREVSKYDQTRLVPVLIHVLFSPHVGELTLHAASRSRVDVLKGL